MTNIVAFIRSHAVATYVVLTFAISWGGMLVLVGPGGFPANGQPFEQQLLLAYLALLAGPGVAGLALTALLDGKAGLRDFGSRLFKWRVGASWYALALLTAPLLIIAVLLALSLASPDFLPRLMATEDKAALLQFSIASALLVGIFEELGWTGFAVHVLLRRRNGFVRTGLTVGFALAVWNALVVYWVSSATATAGSLPMVIFLPLTLFTWLPTYRVLMVWVYDHTQSLFVAIIMHTALVVCWTSLTPLTLSGTTIVIYYLVFTAALWVVIAAVAVTGGVRVERGRLSMAR